MNDNPGQNPEAVSNPLPAAPPANWRTALADLLGSRAALIQYELKQAAATNVRKVILFAAAAFFLLVFWLVLVTGLVGLISAQGGYLWYTLQEFKKDREWLQTFQSPGKSND
jgi:hypothetical protein